MNAAADSLAIVPFDDILAPLAQGDRVTVPPHWGQGRATFGGLVAALLYRRARAVLEDAGLYAGKPPRSLTFSLVAPLAPGEARVDAQVLRTGKSVTQLEARIVQDGQVAAVMLASFGAARASEVLVAAAPVPSYADIATLPALPFIAGVTPDFTQHFEMRWAVGQLPFVPPPATTGDMGGWVRFRQPTRGTEIEHLLGLVDAWPPAVLPMFRKPAPISTLTWTIEFTAAAVDDMFRRGSADTPFGYLAQTELSADGYAHVASRFWRADGTLLAIGRQTIAIFA
ncbi:MAG: acyl-CoA thioesterase [Pseudomonadota bacterium]